MGARKKREPMWKILEEGKERGLTESKNYNKKTAKNIKFIFRGGLGEGCIVACREEGSAEAMRER